jgi:hypothetical protein
VVAGAAGFDAAMGVACLAAAGSFGGWLSIPVVAVRTTGVVFLAAAAAGAWTARRSAADVRVIVAANAVFALWCLVVLAADGPNVLGTVLLSASVLASAATAVLERRLAGA